MPEIYAINGTQKIQWIGNTVYNMRNGSVIFISSHNQLSYVDFVRNTYKVGPWTSTDRDIRFRNKSGVYNRRNQAYLQGNITRFAADPEVLADQKLMARVLAADPATAPTDPQDVNEWVVASSVGTPALPMLTGAEFNAYVLANAGNSLYRDSIDARAASEAANGTGQSSMYTSAAAAGGYPALPSGTYPTCADGVISDAWRAAHGESRDWYELDTGGTGRMVLENYADDVADGLWVEP